ncbi:Lysophospholipase; Monoglyceride lipase; putative [Actinomycetales bacterium JB111]|nr:Lysophospholipase; Monoglyceride lipase; putative [Actinomycetales bacterium JB111]
MALHEVEFTSHNGRDAIQGWIYEPVVPARAIVHIIHGLGEHSRRYQRLITILLDEGFVVVADDHAGHGKTAMVSGVWQDAGEDAAATVVEDERTLLAKARERHPDLPYVVFGHSWGSVIARGIVDEEIDGLILCGIAARWTGIESTIDRAALASGDQEAPADPVLVEQFFDRFTERCGPDPRPTAWVAADANIVQDHSVDPLNNFGAPMTLRFLRGFVELYDQVNAEEWYGTVRDDLPVLILAGDQDPVAGYGEGAYLVANRLVDSGTTDVRTVVWADLRHEVHNEPESRDELADEVITFVEKFLD